MPPTRTPALLTSSSDPTFLLLTRLPCCAPAYADPLLSGGAWGGGLDPLSFGFLPTGGFARGLAPGGLGAGGHADGCLAVFAQQHRIAYRPGASVSILVSNGRLEMGAWDGEFPFPYLPALSAPTRGFATPPATLFVPALRQPAFP